MSYSRTIRPMNPQITRPTRPQLERPMKPQPNFDIRSAPGPRMPFDQLDRIPPIGPPRRKR
jgi:hypothetical protein